MSDRYLTGVVGASTQGPIFRFTCMWEGNESLALSRLPVEGFPCQAGRQDTVL